MPKQTSKKGETGNGKHSIKNENNLAILV